MSKVFIFDANYCNGCYGCQFACKDEHCGNDWSPIAKPQPNTGQFWCKVEQRDHGSVPKVRVEYKPIMCNHCEQCQLLAQAPECCYRNEFGMVIIDPQKAAGRSDLAGLCPQGNVYWNEELQLAQKCTGCSHLVAEGKTPRCVEFCATGALKWGDEEEFAAEIARAETACPKESGPKVFYLNLPHLFIAGDVWDPEQDEVIEGAKVTLTMPDGSQRVELTDDFGDFWFRKLDEGSYSVTVEAEGYRPVARSVELSKSENLGDFPLERI